MSTSALTIATTAFGLLNVYMPGEPPSGPDGDSALVLLNLMMGSWAQQRGTIPVVAREVFNLTADKGGISNPYTIGSGGNFDTARPVGQSSLVGVGLLMNPGDDDEVEIQLAVYTDQEWQALAVKGDSQSQPSGAYYKPTYTGALGTLYLWPIPDNPDHDLVLYFYRQIAAFADLTTAYDFPDGYEIALTYNLADMLQTPYGRTLSDSAMKIAVNSLAQIKRTNLPISEIPCDPMLAGIGTRGRWYNIETGQ